jgi:hypothetical protein
MSCEEYKKQFFSDLSEYSYREFNEFEEKCVAVHNRNKHKIVGVVNL